MSRSGVEVVVSRGCSRLALPGMQSSSVSAASSSFSRGGGGSAAAAAAAARRALTDGPFSGLVICVTGLSKEARNQVKEATESMGGEYSGSLHPKCTHLVVQSFAGRKFEHAVKHGPKNGLFVVTLGWFVHCMRRNMRLDESLYGIKNMGENGMPLGEFNRLVGTPVSENSCLPPIVFQEKAFSDTTEKHRLQTSRKEHDHDEFVFTNDSIYIDPGISGEMRNKVSDAAAREGAKFLDHWFIGCHATYVVCEDTSVKRYVGHSDNIVTPLWILKTAKEKGLQRLVHLSSDLARQVAIILENAETFQENRKIGGVPSINSNPSGVPSTQGEIDETRQERQKFVEVAKKYVRDRRARRMQSCEVPIHPITPVKLMESICWTVSEPATSACIYTESSWSDDAFEQQSSTTFFDASGDGKDPDQSTDNFSRPLRESEKSEVIFKNHFLTILFPIDRFGELGPSSRTFFSNGGFTRIQVLDHIYNFYQENMSSDEINVALHSDSRHADRLRSLYASTESAERGFVTFKRIDFLGSRRSFEGLKRFSRENNSNVYELVIRA